VVKKIDKTDLAELKEIQDSYTMISNQLAANAVDEHYVNVQLQQLRAQKSDILNSFDRTQQREKTLMDSLREKYGDGEINIQEGTFTPNEKEG
jgi:hypothetical protein